MFGNAEQMRRMMSGDVIKPKSVGATLSRLARYFTHYWPALILVAVFITVNTWAQVTAPDLIGQAVDCYLSPPGSSAVGGFPGAPSDNAAVQTSNCWLAADSTLADASDPLRRQLRNAIFSGATVPTLAELSALDIEGRIAGLGRLIGAVAVLYVGGALLIGAAFFAMTWAGQQVLREIRVELFRHMQGLSLGYYAEHEAGDLMSRITNDASAVEQAMNFALIQVLGAALLLVWTMVVMLSKSLAFGLLSLAVVPAMFVATLWLSEQARKAFRESRKELGSLNAELQESTAAVREVQAFNRAEENIKNFMATNAANRDANVRAVAFTSALQPALEALSYVALALVAGVGGYYLLTNQPFFGTVVSLGLVITFLQYVQRFNQPVSQIALLWTNLQSAIAGAERIFGLLDDVPSVQDKPDAKSMPAIKGEVVFDNASAAYKKGVPVLNAVSFAAQPGQTVAIVGPTGAGKTTIINLIPRFYDVTGGSVLIDGVDVRTVTKESLRHQIGIVLQDTFLFSASVMENIRFGRPGASDADVMAAAKLAHADLFIERLPDGYNTVLGERGSGLSQGQRQLISIARAALANPRLLILDEATSSVDTRTERLIQQAFDKLLTNRTSFVIAHRLSTIRNADVILVLNQGEIIERGKFDELLANKGFFYDLYMSQFRAQEAVNAADAGAGANGHRVEAVPAA
ncbi:MAG: ABC transporter ATP-binding protein [Anaerolineales bacterium]